MTSSVQEDSFDENDEDLRRAIALSLDGFQTDPSPDGAVVANAPAVPPSASATSARHDHEQPSLSHDPGNIDVSARHLDTLSTRWDMLLSPPNCIRKDACDNVQVLLDLIAKAKSNTTEMSYQLDLAIGHSLAANSGVRMEPSSVPSFVISGLRVLFGSPLMLTAEEFKRWWQSSFRFSTQCGFLGFCLIQDYGGPCGVLASLQCWMFVHLLLHPSNALTALLPHSSPQSNFRFSSRESLHYPSTPDATSPSATLNAHCMPPVDAEIMCTALKPHALAWALSVCLYRCTSVSRYHLVELTSPYSSMRLPSQMPLSLHDLALCLTARVVTYSSIQDVYWALYRTLNLLGNLTPASLLSFVLSVVLTRGERLVREDMDDSSLPLVGLYGHCSQELVNLLLTGEAVTNVFDGDRTLPGGTGSCSTDSVPAYPRADSGDAASETLGLHLKGVHRKQVVGYLTELEALRYCQVGHYLKSPAFPVWVVGSPNHFTSMFSTDFSICKYDSSEERAANFARVFDTVDAEGIGLLPSQKLPRLLALCDMTKLFAEAQRVLDPPGQGGAILKTEFIEWAKSKQAAGPQGNMSLNKETSSQRGTLDPPLSPLSQPHCDTNSAEKPSSKRCVLYHYDGQGTSQPRLTRLMIEPMDIECYGTEGNDGVPNDLSLILRTKWKHAFITGQILT